MNLSSITLATNNEDDIENNDTDSHLCAFNKTEHDLSVINSDITWIYSVQVVNESASPILSFINHTTAYQQVFNPSWIPSNEQVSHSGLIVEVQNCSLLPGNCTFCNSNHGLLFTACNPLRGGCDPLLASSLRIQQDSTHITNNYANPSIFYDNNIYYMFTEALHMNPKLKHMNLYTSIDPTNSTATWQLKEDAFHQRQLTAPATLLTHNTHTKKHYLFFGGKGFISVSNSCLLTDWQNMDDSPWLSPRTEYFDNNAVETGPTPIQLNIGSYLMLYNTYNASQYSVGWVILDGNNPSKILQRSTQPLLTAKFNYQIGDAPYTCTQRNSVYAKAMVRLNSTSNSTELFRVYFSAAGTSIGSAVIQVSYNLSSEDAINSWLRIAVMVSICCIVFVMIMLVVICCARDSPSALYVPANAQFSSIASAVYPRDSSICHATPYVIGRLDSYRNAATNDYNEKHKHNILFDTNGYNPNHIHACSAKCYEHDKECNYLKQNRQIENGLRISLDSNTSSSCSCGTRSSSSYCTHCDRGEYHCSDKKQENSESMRLSQISFKINETLET